MIRPSFDLAASARAEMVKEGFDPDFPAGSDEQIAALRARDTGHWSSSIRDMRDSLWSSIDNASSRDLDQIEVAEHVGNDVRILIAIADVDSAVSLGSPLDRHAAVQTTTVYTPVAVFPMLPVEISTDLTSLNENQDRLAIVIEMLISRDGSIASSDVYRALVRNKAQLSYEAIGPWLERAAAAASPVAASAELQAQLRLQDEAAALLRDQRQRLGALNFDRTEASSIVVDGEVKGLVRRDRNRASNLIEDFMIAANEVMARTLAAKGVSNIRRVVKAPERWPRIVQLASTHGTRLPEQPDSAALAVFLKQQKEKDPVRYADLSLAVIKLLGPGEYVLARAGESTEGHFGLAVQDYTHSTAPNRRFADLVTQRLIKASLADGKPPYTDDELAITARTCTFKEDAARKVERTMSKRVAAVALEGRKGQTFDAIVTGVTPKGVFVRALDPPVDGRLMRGEAGVDVGDRIRVQLLDTDPQRGYIDFAR